MHERLLTIDAHADIEIPGRPSAYVGPDGLSKVAPEKMRAGSLDAVVMAAAVGPKPRTAAGYAEARAIAESELSAGGLRLTQPIRSLWQLPPQRCEAHRAGQRGDSSLKTP